MREILEDRNVAEKDGGQESLETTWWQYLQAKVDAEKGVCPSLTNKTIHMVAEREKARQ